MHISSATKGFTLHYMQKQQTIQERHEAKSEKNAMLTPIGATDACIQ